MLAEPDRTNLFGRDGEVKALRQAFHRTIGVELDDNVLKCGEPEGNGAELGTQGFVLIQGRSGSGKTALANSLRQEVHQYSGFFLSGKFGLTSVRNPYAVLVAAFNQFVAELAKRANGNHNDCFLVELRKAIQDAVGTEGRLLMDIIPSLEWLIGTQSANCDIQGTNAVRRFQYLFCKLCRAISSIVPLVFFFDDLQWSDPASLQLLQSLLHSQPGYQSSSMLVVAACRDENVASQASASLKDTQQLSLSSFLGELEKDASSNKISIHKIQLGFLDPISIHRLVSDFLRLDLDSSMSLASDIYLKCQGSPFHALQILNDISTKGNCPENSLLLLTRESSDELDNDDSLRSSSGITTESVNELLRDRLKSLPELTLRVLKLCACLGDEIDESAVAVVMELDVSEIHQATQIAAENGHLAFDQARGLHRFSHDQIRQEVMSLIDDIDSMSFLIGYSLWTKATPLFLSTKMFVIANLLNHGIGLLTDQTERYRAAALNWEAGIKAASLANFADSSRYLAAGIEFLKGGDYWADQYDLSLTLFNAAADTEVGTQSFARVHELVQEVLNNASTLHDKIQAYIAKINCLCQSGYTQQALTIGIDVLQQLGEPMPQNATKGAVIRETILTKLLLTGRSSSDMMSFRPMENKDKLHAMHLLAVLVPYAYQARSYYNPLMATRMVRLCLKYGFHKSGAMGLVTYGWVMCSHNTEEGYRLGSQALSMVERLRAKEMIPRVYTTFYGFTHFWKRHMRLCIEPLKSAAATAMDVGDVECAMWAKFLRCNTLLVCAVPLSQVAAEFEETAEQLRLYKQDNLLTLIRFSTRYINRLMGRAPDTGLVANDITSESEQGATSNSTLLKYVRIALEANVAYRFGDFEQAGRLTEAQRSLKYDFGATFSSCSARQLDALIGVACVRLGKEKRKNLKIARQTLKCMKRWAADCSENFLSLQCMLDAELRSLQSHTGVNKKTLALYDKSVEEGVKQGYIQLAALACELAGDYVDRQGEAVLARQYWEESHRQYIAWGAAAKAAQLVNRTGISVLRGN